MLKLSVRPMSSIIGISASVVFGDTTNQAGFEEEEEEAEPCAEGAVKNPVVDEDKRERGEGVEDDDDTVVEPERRGKPCFVLVQQVGDIADVSIYHTSVRLAFSHP